MTNPSLVPSMLQRSRASLRARQKGFARALLDPQHEVPPGLVGPDGVVSAKRFSVYRNNVAVALIDALRSAFPATCRIVGNEFFSAMAQVHATQMPPDSPVMLEYGRDFSNFISGFEPVGGLPYLADVARLEWAWIEAYHARESDSIPLAQLSGVEPQQLLHARLTLHPSMHLVRSAYPIVTIWYSNIEETALAFVDLETGAQNALVLRAAATVVVRTVPLGTAAFIQSLQHGAALSDAATAAMNEDLDLDLSELLTHLFAMGAVIGYEIPSSASMSEEAPL